MALPTFQNRALFDKKSYSDIADPYNGAYSITILSNNDPSLIVTGLLNEGISLGVSPEYDDTGIGSVVNNNSLVAKFKDKADLALALSNKSINASGFITRKFYRKSGYLELNPSFRVVNWDGKAQPIKSAMLLLSLCLPKHIVDVKIKDVYETIKQASGAIANVGGGIFNTIAEQGTALAEAIGGETPSTGGTVNNPLKKNIINGAQKIENGNIALTNSPSRVTVRISNYFNNEDMIIEDLSVEFSKEMTSSGPLYADFKIKLSSSEMLTEDKLGFNLANGYTNRRARLNDRVDVARGI